MAIFISCFKAFLLFSFKKLNIYFPLDYTLLCYFACKVDENENVVTS